MEAVDVIHLNCDCCPALPVRNVPRIAKLEALRMKALRELRVGLRMVILCESAPASRFVYDPESNYDASGLRANLREELVPGGNDQALFEFMNNRGIWIVDAALCPLHLLNNRRQRRDAATKCLLTHTCVYLASLPSVPMLAIFPVYCGFLRRQAPSVAARIQKYFDFSRLNGLRQLIDQLVPGDEPVDHQL